MLLRHRPEKANLTLNREGWCSIQQLITNTDFTEAELSSIVFDDDKSRYSFSKDASSIRANQGHSTSNVRMTFEVTIPPPILYHGASEEFIDVIRKKGLLPMKRHHVHLSKTIDVAEAVGGRRRKGYIVLSIDAKQMLTDGYKFMISENGVYLSDHIPAKYLKELV